MKITCSDKQMKFVSAALNRVQTYKQDDSCGYESRCIFCNKLLRAIEESSDIGNMHPDWVINHINHLCTTNCAPI